MIVTRPGADLLRRRTLARLRHGPTTTRALADALGVAVLSAGQALSVLEARGEVVREGRMWAAVGAALGVT